MKKAMSKAKTKTKTRARTKAATPVRTMKSKEYRPEDLIRTNGSMELDPNLMHMKTARAMAKSLKVSADGSKLRRAAASGVYFYRLVIPGATETRKMVLLK